MVARLSRQVVKPAAVFIGAAVAVGVLIVLIGSALLGLFNPEATSELARPELWIAVVAALAVLGVSALLAREPSGRVGVLDRQTVIGDRPFFAPEPPPLDVTMRRGPRGGVSEIKEGDTIWAQSGPLARVIALLPGEEEYGKRRRGLLYASGLYGASDELWIPVEAVVAVYPETGSVFLAAKGDETEHFGWNKPPQSFVRGPERHSSPSSF